MRLSIAVCSRNNCASLLRTLDSLRHVHLQFSGELLIVDNGSSDGTWNALSSYTHPTLTVRPIRENSVGLSYARNRVLAESTGEIIAFTDDDVRVPPNWIDSLTRPLLEKRAEGVVGGIRIAQHLMRPWMTATHRAWLCSTDTMNPADPHQLIGANMAFVRSVIAKVPAYDVELGPGRLGAWDETLFSWQLKEAGFRLLGAFDHSVDHHFAESRLSRASLLRAAQIQGRCHAYVLHHWQHGSRIAPRRQLLKRLPSLLRLYLTQMRKPSREGMPESELALIASFYMDWQWLRECRRPRHYDRRGLKRLPHVPGTSV